MVTISRSPIGYSNGWSYNIRAAVPKERAMHLLDKYVQPGHGHSSFSTYDPEMLIISLNDTHPKFIHVLAKVIAVCTDLENKGVGKLSAEIEALQAKRASLIRKTRGKNA